MVKDKGKKKNRDKKERKKMIRKKKKKKNFKKERRSKECETETEDKKKVNSTVDGGRCLYIGIFPLQLHGLTSRCRGCRVV